MANKNPSPSTRFRSGKEAETMGKNGGIKSGETRALTKTFRECMRENMTDEKMQALFEMLYNRAIRGNLKAFELLRDTMGEKPVANIELVDTIEIDWGEDPDED